MKVTIEFGIDDVVLSDAAGKEYVVLALSALHVCPAAMNFGRVTMKVLLEYASLGGYDFFIGFASLDVIDFYRKCGFVVSDKPYKWKDEDRLLFSNKQIPDDLVIKETW